VFAEKILGSSLFIFFIGKMHVGARGSIIGGAKVRGINDIARIKIQ